MSIPPLSRVPHTSTCAFNTNSGGSSSRFADSSSAERIRTPLAPGFRVQRRSILLRAQEIHSSPPHRQVKAASLLLYSGIRSLWNGIKDSLLNGLTAHHTGCGNKCAKHDDICYNILPVSHVPPGLQVSRYTGMMAGVDSVLSTSISDSPLAVAPYFQSLPGT